MNQADCPHCNECTHYEELLANLEALQHHSDAAHKRMRELDEECARFKFNWDYGLFEVAMNRMGAENTTLRAIVGELVEALDDACSVYDPMSQMARIVPLIARARAVLEGKP